MGRPQPAIDLAERPQLVEGVLAEGDRQRMVADGGGSVGRPLDDGGPIGARDPCRVRDGRPQLERSIEVGAHLGERRHPGGFVGGQDGGGERGRRLVGAIPVVRDLRLARPAGMTGLDAVLESAREPAVEDGPLRRQRLVVQRLGHEGMAERVDRAAPVVQREQHLGLDRGPEPPDRLLVLDLGELHEQLVIESTADRRRDLEERSRVVGQRHQSDREDVAERVGQVPVRERAARDELLDEERVAVGPLVEARDRGRVHIRSDQLRQERRRLGPVQRRELDALHRREAAELGHEREDGVATVDLVASIREDQQHPVVALVAGEVAHEVAGRSVGPVHVLDHQRRRSIGGQPADDAEDALEQASLRRRLGWRRPVHGGPAAEEPTDAEVIGAEGGLVHHVSHRVDERGERCSVVAELDAPADEDAAAVGLDPIAEGRDQPRLADAGLPADHHAARLAGSRPPERGGQPSRFLGSADHHRAGHAQRHDRHHPTVPVGGDPRGGARWIRARRRCEARSAARSRRRSGSGHGRTCGPVPVAGAVHRASDAGAATRPRRGGRRPAAHRSPGMERLVRVHASSISPSRDRPCAGSGPPSSGDALCGRPSPPHFCRRSRQRRDPPSGSRPRVGD